LQDFSVFFFGEVDDLDIFLQGIGIRVCRASITVLEIGYADLTLIDQPSVSFVHAPRGIAFGDVFDA
jgi:hypothetical protein